jgi:uncharacterized protein YuzE
MKKLAIVLFLAGALLSLSQCELFQSTVEYNIAGNSDSLMIRYNDKSDQIVDVTTVSPWVSGDFILYSGDKPFVAYIEVTNNGGGEVTVEVLENGDVAGTMIVAAGANGHIHPIIE